MAIDLVETMGILLVGRREREGEGRNLRLRIGNGNWGGLLLIGILGLGLGIRRGREGLRMLGGIKGGVQKGMLFLRKRRIRWNDNIRPMPRKTTTNTRNTTHNAKTPDQTAPNQNPKNS